MARERWYRPKPGTPVTVTDDYGTQAAAVYVRAGRDRYGCYSLVRFDNDSEERVHPSEVHPRSDEEVGR